MQTKSFKNLFLSAQNCFNQIKNNGTCTEIEAKIILEKYTNK